ncbi:MAG: dephospho-CoA kinase [Bacteroidota bacterium]
MSNKVALTGNIGSGKSTIGHLFSLMGIPIYNADNEGKKFLFQASIKEAMVDIIGENILDKEHNIIFSEMAKIIFENDVLLSKVNAVIHPLVIADYFEWEKLQNTAPFTIFESSIIFEHHLESNFDFVVDVYCPDEIAINRAIQRGFQSEIDINNRLKRQLNTEIKKSKADFVINNYNNFSVIEQISTILPLLCTEKV